MKILIIGGAGYIGSHINRYLNENGISTLVLDNLSSGHREAVIGGELIVGDFGDSYVLSKIMSTEKIDAVMHFAALASVGDSMKFPDVYYEQNVNKMSTLLNAMVKYNVNYFIFSSSAAVFGEPIEIPISETHPKNPVNPYGKTKLIGEYMLDDYDAAFGIKSCCLRYFNAAGASYDSLLGESHDPEQHLIPLVLKTASGEREMLKVFGDDYNTSDGTCLRDYVHVEDLADAHYKGLMKLLNDNESIKYNLGSKTGFTVNEVISKAKEITELSIRYEVVGRRKGDPAKLVASNDKACKELDWVPERSHLERIITDAWNWEKNKKF